MHPCSSDVVVVVVADVNLVHQEGRPIERSDNDRKVVPVREPIAAYEGIRSIARTVDVWDLRCYPCVGRSGGVGDVEDLQIIIVSKYYYSKKVLVLFWSWNFQTINRKLV